MSAEDSSAQGSGAVNDITQSIGRLNAKDAQASDEDQVQRTDEEYDNEELTIRAIVSSKEAGAIIGKQGFHVSELRKKTGVKNAGVSKVVPGVHDRVLTVTGALKGVAEAYQLIAKTVLGGTPQIGMGGVSNSNGTHIVKLLISHNQMGTIIGRQGLKIKEIQDYSNARMVAQKEMLPQSTERIVEVQGTPEAIEKAVWQIGKCLIDDAERGYGTVFYNPAVRVPPGNGPASNGVNRSYNRTGNGADFNDGPSQTQRTLNPHRGDNRNTNEPRNNNNNNNSGNGNGNGNGNSNSNLNGAPPVEDGEETQTQNISIPADMVGCIIGRQGIKISQIRKESGARISIAKVAHDESGERMFTITGSAECSERALYLLYESLEAEKLRRLAGSAKQE